MTSANHNGLIKHLVDVKEGKRRFENAFQSVARMILENPIEKIVANGKTTYDFSIFRNGRKHIIGMYDEINSLGVIPYWGNAYHDLTVRNFLLIFEN